MRLNYSILNITEAMRIVNGFYGVTSAKDFAAIPGSTYSVVAEIADRASIDKDYKLAILSANSWGLTSYIFGNEFLKVFKEKRDFKVALEKEKDLMKRRPQRRNVPLLNKEMKTIIFIIGVATDILLLGLFFWLWNQNHNIAYVRTMIFACLTIDSLFYVFACKSLRRNIWHINPFSNRFLLLSAIVGVLMLLVAIYLPWGQIMLKTISLGFGDWLIVFGLGLIELLLIEIAKYHFITKKDYA